MDTMIKYRIKQAKIGITLGVFAVIMAWMLFAILSPKIQIIYLSVALTLVGFVVMLLNSLTISKMKKAIIKESKYVTSLARKYLLEKELDEKFKLKS